MCEAPLALKALPEFAGDEAPMRLALSGMPALSCDKPHVYFVRRDFALWLMNRLVDEELGRLPAGGARGLLFKRYHCGECGAALAARPDHLHTFRAELVLEPWPAFLLKLTLPLYRCGGCGREQLRSRDEARRLAPSALVHAFKEGGIKPPA